MIATFSLTTSPHVGQKRTGAFERRWFMLAQATAVLLNSPLPSQDSPEKREGFVGERQRNGPSASPVSALDAFPPVSESRRPRQRFQPSGALLRTRRARPPLWIGTPPRCIRVVRRSRRNSSLFRRRTVPRLGPAGGASQPAWPAGRCVPVQLHARSLGTASPGSPGSSTASLSSPSAKRPPEA